MSKTNTNTNTESDNSYTFPQIHSFPPFYTRQLHEETWQKQRDLWIEMILGYCGAKRIFEINLSQESVYTMDLFFNPKIDRKMDKEFLQEILAQMAKTGKASTTSTALIFWRRPEEWSQLIYKFVERIGGIGSIYTVYDLIDGDDTIKEEFHGIPDNLIKIVIEELERSGKARLFADDPSTSLKEKGLKFF